MYFFNRLAAVVAAAALVGPLAPIEARTKQGDKFLAQGRVRETKKEWDAALELYEKALSEDPADIVYQMAAEKTRFQAAQSHIDKGLKVRSQGLLGEALIEFQKAYAINTSSAAADQEFRRTRDMIERERKRTEESGKESSPEQKALTPVEQMKRETDEKFASMLPVPELRPLSAEPIRLKMTNTPKVLFETVAKVAGINVIWDPDMNPQPTGKPLTVEVDNSTLEQALDYLSVITKSYWKALSPNTIFITNDNINKRRDYEEQVAKVFYLSNISNAQEIMEILNAVRNVADLQRIFPYNAQNAIIAKGSADQMALAEKFIHDLDKPKSEVVVDIIVMDASSVYTRQLTAAIASGGLKVPFSFTPRSGLSVVTNANTTGTTADTTTGTNTGTTTTTTTGIPLSNLGHLSSADFSTILPDAMLQAIMTDSRTKVLQTPQVRSVDNVKATLNIGDRVPTASGSFQPGMGAVGMNPLVNTQFQMIDVGVNVSLLPRVHDNGDVSMHIDLDISSVTGHVNLGGIDQPIIGQRKISHDIRMHEGEVNLLGGLITQQESKAVGGVPGLSSIPLIRRLFTSESVDRERRELMIALIPHIVRRPEYTAESLRAIAVGSQQAVHLNYGPRAGSPQAPAAQPATTPKPEPSGAAPPPATAPPAATLPATAPPPPATAPPATAPPPPAGNTRVYFQPAQSEVNLSGAITVALVVESGTDVSSAPIQIQFDPKILRLNDVVRGEFFSSDGQQPVFAKNILNDTGTATVTLNRLPGTPGVTGSGGLVNIIFQAVGRGGTTVSSPNLTIRNSQGQVVATGSPQLAINVK